MSSFETDDTVVYILYKKRQFQILFRNDYNDADAGKVKIVQEINSRRKIPNAQDTNSFGSLFSYEKRDSKEQKLAR
jgi:hypothetical protein